MLDPVLLAKIAGVVLVLNIILSGLKAILDKLAPTTATEVDDKAAGILGVLLKLLDVLSANVEHK